MLSASGSASGEGLGSGFALVAEIKAIIKMVATQSKNLMASMVLDVCYCYVCNLCNLPLFVEIVRDNLTSIGESRVIDFGLCIAKLLTSKIRTCCSFVECFVVQKL